MPATELSRIVIIGGGAGGLELATALGKTLGKKQQAHITLVDANLTHLWKPLWHEVAAGTLNSHEDEINYITHAYSHHFHFQVGKMIGLNRAKKEILLAPIIDESNQETILPERSIYYDLLVIAVGSVSNAFNTPGVNEHCWFLDTRAQADRFQQHFIKTFMETQRTDKTPQEKQLTIAIVGAGATGVELAAELHYATQQALKYGWAQIPLQQPIKIIIIEAAKTILSALPDSVIKMTEKQLKKRNVDIVTNERVTQVTVDGLSTNTGRYITGEIKVWAAGIKAPDFLKNLDGLETNHLNQLLVTPTLQTTIDNSIFAFGDCASCPLPNGKFVPPRAQAAHQQASLLVKSLAKKIQNKSLSNYHYHDYGSLISLSRPTAIGNLMGRILGDVFISGLLARIAYISLYRKHQIALFGLWRVILITFADWLTTSVKPRLKLH